MASAEMGSLWLMWASYVSSDLNVDQTLVGRKGDTGAMAPP